MARALTQEQPQTAGETYDVVIVGAGVAGALIGSNCAGGRQGGDPGSGTARRSGRSGQSLSRRDRQDAGIALSRDGVGASPYVLDLDLYYVQSGPEHFKNTYERRVGGTTWHWLGTSLRLLPATSTQDTVRRRRRLAVLVRRAEPWYGEAERELGVAGDRVAEDHGAPRSTDYPMPPIPAPSATSSGPRPRPRLA